ncbi:MAG TPA: hypothetical protein VEY70_14215 [Metabacillus sp.]|nr:hypothetical protein [Metabacillus sp.]
MEITFEVKPIGVKYVCDSCGEGEMVPNGKNDFKYEVKIGHTCSKCGLEKDFAEKYPLIRYEFFDKNNI